MYPGQASLTLLWVRRGATLAGDRASRGKMNVLLVHNRYQNPGGEDGVFEAERALLTRRGHRVLLYQRHNDEIQAMGRARLARETLWSSSHGQLRRLLRRQRRAGNPVEVAHFHNTFPLISPAAYHACRREGAAVVQTLHNFRLLCANALLYRDGRVCEACVGLPFSLAGAARGCYHGSRPASAMVAAMQGLHRLLGSWRRVDAYIVLSRFARDRFVRGGLPAGRIHVKANFLTHPPGPGQLAPAPGQGALFAGRFCPEKGVSLLLRAWRGLEAPLTLLGDGPEGAQVRRLVGRLGRADAPGWVAGPEVDRAIRRAAFVVIPSRWYEGLPMVILQAFAQGRPVLAARLGGLAEVVREGETGRLFTPGDAADLRAVARQMLADPEGTARMGRAARRHFDAHFTAGASYDRLLEIYSAARQQHQRQL